MSIMKFIDGYMNGNAWEDLCVKCYKLRYKDEHYTWIPATQSGDGGIEGYTLNGIVHQCYCPEREYNDNELYEHLRKKITTDINKLISPNYSAKLKSWGVPTIAQWHFVIPEYRDARILAHAETKRQEIMTAKKKDPDNYDYIDEDFRILIKTADEFAPEISRIIRTNLTDMKLNLAIEHTGIPDWSKCESEKVENIRRKIKAVMHMDDDTNEDLNFIVNMYIEFYISGIEIMNSLRIDAPEFYEDLYKLEQSYKNEVKIKTRINTNKQMNQSLFYKILDDFQIKLESDFSKVLTQASIGEVKQDLVSSWLADCSMEFKGV